MITIGFIPFSDYIKELLPSVHFFTADTTWFYNFILVTEVINEEALIDKPAMMYYMKQPLLTYKQRCSKLSSLIWNTSNDVLNETALADIQAEMF